VCHLCVTYFLITLGILNLPKVDSDLGFSCGQLVCDPLHRLQRCSCKYSQPSMLLLLTPQQGRDSFAKVATGNLLTTWIYRLSYILDLCLIKTSILLFYNHIASARKSFHLLVRTLLAINLLGGSSMIVAAVFTCYPISDSWSFEVFEKGLHGIHATQCYNPGPFWIANATYNLVTDVVIWLVQISNVPSHPIF